MGRERRLKLWAEIEIEFGEPVADVIMGLRQQGNSWRTVAGALDIALSTLKEWRRELGLPLDQHDNVYDPSSMPDYTPTDRKAQAMGYQDATDAVLDMRLKQGLTIKQVADRMGCHYCTVTSYTPLRLRGEIYNRSEAWWVNRRQQVRDMLDEFLEKKRANREWHPFNRDNGVIFGG